MNAFKRPSFSTCKTSQFLNTACATHLLSLVLALLTLPTVVQAQFSYVTNNGTITITGYSGSGGAVTIPSIIAGLPVTSIGDYAFYRCVNVYSVTIPNTVSSIGEYAFSMCYSLTSVMIPSAVTNIGVAPFAYCNNLAAIGVDSDNPAYISLGGILFNRSQATLIQYPPSNITNSYTIPNTVTRIEDDAFVSCQNLITVTIPNNVTSIGYEAFFNCVILTNVTIPNNVTNIGDWAFCQCPLSKLTVPSSITSIGRGVFSSCYWLTNVTIPNTVTNLGNYAFDGCHLLTSIYFLGDSPSLGGYAFNEVANDAVVYYLPGTTGWATTFGGLPAALWNPQVQAGDGSFGAGTNGMGFTITGTPNIPIVVEACANLANDIWLPLQTCKLTNGSTYFSDPQWPNYPSRFYRIRSP